MAKERALDIFYLLDKIDRKQYDIWQNLTEEQRKEFSPLVAMRWMAGTTDPVQIIFLNEIVNTTVYSFPDYKEFLLKLLTVCSNGRPKRYQWVQYKVAGSRKVKKSVEMIAHQYTMTIEEAEDARRLFSKNEIMELGEAMGLQKDEMAELKKELA